MVDIHNMHKIVLYCQVIKKHQENSFVCILAFTLLHEKA